MPAHHVRSLVVRPRIRQSWKRSIFQVQSDSSRRDKSKLNASSTAHILQLGPNRRESRSEGEDGFVSRYAPIFKLGPERESHLRDDSATASPAPLGANRCPAHVCAPGPPRTWVAGSLGIPSVPGPPVHDSLPAPRIFSQPLSAVRGPT